MRGSSVLLGLKSLASSFHQQLPLSQKESQRLLTALTSSFRQHLDTFHPRTASEDHAHLIENVHGDAAKTNHHSVHSSAIVADRHLATMLTNPLLARGSEAPNKPDRDYANANLELQKDAAKDPISLLEEYHEKGAATVSIARLCLQVFKESLHELSEGARQKAIMDRGAGQRVLSWLWASEQYQQSAYADDVAFVKLLVSFLVKEGHEERIWNWIGLDHVLADFKAPGQDVQRMRHPYRWKGRLVREMVVTKLDPPYDERGSADAALDVFFKACEMKRSALQHDYMRHLPLFHAGNSLCHVLTGPRQIHRPTDPQRFDRFIDSSKLYLDDHKMYEELFTARLGMNHPQRPTAQPMLTWLRHCLDSPDPVWRKFDRSLRPASDPSDRRNRKWVHMMAQAAACLSEEGCYIDSQWVIARTGTLFPELARNYLESDMKECLEKSTKAHFERQEPRLGRVLKEPAKADNVQSMSFHVLGMDRS